MGIWSFVFPGSCELITLTVPAQVLVATLYSVAVVAVFFPKYAVFLASLRISVLV